MRPPQIDVCLKMGKAKTIFSPQDIRQIVPEMSCRAGSKKKQHSTSTCHLFLIVIYVQAAIYDYFVIYNEQRLQLLPLQISKG